MVARQKSWVEVVSEADRLREQSIIGLFDQDSERSSFFSVQDMGFYLDFSKQCLDRDAWQSLLNLAEAHDLKSAFQRLDSGVIVNQTQSQQAVHTKMRAAFLGKRDCAEVDWHRFSEQVYRWSDPQFTLPSGESVQDVVHMGIGGSDIAPRFILDALRSYRKNPIRVHFVSSNDCQAMRDVLSKCDPKSTVGVIVSKSFTTAETLGNAEKFRMWLSNRLTEDVSAHLLAVTARPDRAQKKGFSPASILVFPDDLGGRFSSWSAVSLVVALVMGMEQFTAFMRGGYEMDQHVFHTSYAKNLAVIMALLSVWSSRAMGLSTAVVLAYDANLGLLVPYLQQLSMESLGKRVNCQGQVLSHHTGAIIWGAQGPDSQHSFHQLLMQGTRCVPAEFIVPLRARGVSDSDRRVVWANALAQSSVLMNGVDANDPAQVIPGNQPSLTLLVSQLDPYHLGALLALMEHRVYAQSILLDINAFDQWGVERGKFMANALLAGHVESLDPSTVALTGWIEGQIRG